MWFFTKKKEKDLKGYTLQVVNKVGKELDEDIAKLREYEKAAFEGVKAYIDEEIAKISQKIDKSDELYKDITNKHLALLEKIVGGKKDDEKSTHITPAT